MINYFYRNKGSINPCEDTLTSTVFDLLKYLPVEVLWRILKNSLLDDKLPKYSGELLEIEFWPRWDATDTKNQRFVEPDVFLRFEDLDIIIEAKRYDEKQQWGTQLNNEAQAYLNFCEDEGEKDAFIIMLGGIRNTEPYPDIEKKEKRIPVLKTKWANLLNQIIIEKKKIQGLEHSQMVAFNRVFNDMIQGLARHGYFKKDWLKEMKNDMSSITYEEPFEPFSFLKEFKN